MSNAQFLSRLCGVLIMLMALAPGTAVYGADRHINHYYPAPSMVEKVQSKARRITRADRPMRVAFVRELAAQLLSRAYAPAEYIFAKGAQAGKLVIVAAKPGHLDTIFRVRGYLATMAPVARATPVLTQNPQSDGYTFVDLLKTLGFQTITLSDGDSFSHQIVIR